MTSSHRHCHSARSARLLFFVIGPLFLLASRSRELLPDWTIGDATPGSTCMFPGTPLCRIDSQLVSPHPLYNGLFRDTSPGAAKSPDFARTFVWIYNREKPALHHHSPSKKDDSSRISRTLIISKIPSNQQVLRESARFSRIGKSYSNPQDSFESARYLESARLPNATDSRHGFSSIEPQPSTVRHNFGPSVVVRLQSSRDSPDFCGFVGCDTRALSPCLVVLA